MSAIALHRVSDLTVRTITRRVSSVAEQMVRQFSPIMNEEELYKQLIPEENYEVMHKASHLMQKLLYTIYSNSFHAQTYMGNSQTALSVQYYMFYKDDKSHIWWLWPENMNSISKDTKLGEKLIPTVDIARRWKTSLELIEKAFKNLKPAMVMYFMPWLKITIREILDGCFGHIENKNEFVRLLDQPRPRDIPSVNSWLFRMFREGEILLTQYSIVKDNNYKVDSNCAMIVPHIRENLIYPRFFEEYNEFRYIFKPLWE